MDPKTKIQKKSPKKYKVVRNTTEYDYYRIPHNIFPLKSREMIVFVLIHLSTYHYRQGKQTYQYADKRPTSETNPVSLVKCDYSFQHTHIQ